MLFFDYYYLATHNLYCLSLNRRAISELERQQALIRVDFDALTAAHSARPDQARRGSETKNKNDLFIGVVVGEVERLKQNPDLFTGVVVGGGGEADFSSGLPMRL